MKAVDFQLGDSQDFGKPGSFADPRLMRQELALRAGIIIVFDGIGKLVGDVGKERPAQGHVDHLESAADAQERLAASNGLPDQSKFNLVTPPVHQVNPRVRLAAEALNGNVSASGEQDAVQPVQQGAPRRARQPRGDQHRRAAGLVHNHNIFVHQRGYRETVLVLVVVRGQADQRKGHSCS
jgi:hypothetical protein